MTTMPIIDTSKDLTALISQQIKKTPDLIALEDDHVKYTYREFDIKVDALTARLRKHGVGRDGLVGVLMGRSADYVIACVAALRAGGAFLVLELAYPSGLLADVIEDAAPVVVVTHTAHAGLISSDVSLIVLDEEERAITNPKMAPELPAENDLERLAFVSYSSGTTGKPKGILNPHSAPVRSYELRFQFSDLNVGDRVACNVFFVWEILRPLLRGATVVVVPDEASYDPVALVDLLSSRHITETLMTPTLLAAVLSRHPRIASKLPDLKCLWLNGEVVTTDLARRAIKSLPKTRFLNCYSASETHEIACGDIAAILDEKSPYCPVGQLMDPAHTYILDENQQKVAPGESGELFIGGNLLARGYLNLPDTTAKAFLFDPFDASCEGRMYRTGDVARMLPGEILEITGRVGAMIKIRGYSVVPGKVENIIVGELAVSQCAVVAHGDGLERQLVAYIVRDAVAGSRAQLSIDESGLSPSARKTLSSSLAHYMIPALWVELDELPTHEVSGKIDQRRLPPPPDPSSRSNSRPATSNGLDSPGVKASDFSIQAIAMAWSTSLDMPLNAITKEHSFFDLGGHSLTLAHLASRLSKAYGLQIPVSRLVSNATLQGHLETVQAVRDGTIAAIQADLPSILQADSVLPADIKLVNKKPFCKLSDAETVLLTGATGFLGAFLLADLLEHTTANIVCLIRFNDPSEDDYAAAVARLRRNLLDVGLWRDSMVDRIEILSGNLTRKRLGLAQETFDDLASRVDVIVHAGATVNLVYPYASLRAPNVVGTTEILRLACQSGATVQYVSTNGVLPASDKAWSESDMLDITDVPSKLADGYGQTKWVAEQLALEAAKRGVHVKILRAGTISGHSVSGATNAYDLVTALIVESLHIGFAPDISGWRTEMTPVDFVSKAILDLADYDDQDQQRVYHLGDASPVEANSLFEYLAQLGFPTKKLPWEEWVARWTEKRGNHKVGESAFTVDILRGGMPPIEFLRDIIILDDKKTKTALGALQRPTVDDKLMEIYVRHWYARGWLPHAPPRVQARNGLAKLKKRGPLSGKVVVVTGASSGIGAAVAKSLAREGAHVALAARRLDALQGLQKTIEATYNTKVLSHQTDVTKADQVESLITATASSLGPVDIVVSCAGVMYFTMMANCKVEQWDQTVDVNCKGLLHILASTIPGMLFRSSGHIVAISSDAGRKVFPGLGVYSASKFFVEATLQALRVETAGSGLRVTSIQPGNVATDLLGMSTDEEALKKYGEPSGAKVLDADDVARSIVYALKQPEHVAVNEIMIEPRDEPI